MKKSCIKCGSKRTKKDGFTQAGTQRYECLACGHRYVWHNKGTKIYQERIWFKRWIQGDTIGKIAQQSHYSPSKIKQIVRYWLLQEPPEIKYDYNSIKYLLLDGTYFGHDNCSIVLMDYPTGQVIGHSYTIRENYESVYTMAERLRMKGVYPISITVDGKPNVIKGVLAVWPQVKIQRCIYHIIHQGSMWLRTYPKTQAGRDLKHLIRGLGNKETDIKQSFDTNYQEVIEQHETFIRQLSSKTIGEKDVKKALALLKHAYGNMWHYRQDNNIPPTNNKLEGYFSELKQQYRKHKGLSKAHREAYLKWYIYYKNTSK